MNGKKEAEVVVIGRETEREEEVLQFCTAQGRGRGSEVDALSGGRYLKMCAVRKKGGSCRKVYSVDTQDNRAPATLYTARQEPALFASCLEMVSG